MVWTQRAQIKRLGLRWELVYSSSTVEATTVPFRFRDIAVAAQAMLCKDSVVRLL